MKGKSITECLLPTDMVMELTQGHTAILQYKTLSYYADEMNSTSDPVERLQLLTAANLARQIELPVMCKGIPPLAIPIGSTLTATLKNGSKAYIKHIGPKMVNTQVKIVGHNNSFIIETVLNDRVSTRGIGASQLSAVRDHYDILTLKDGTVYHIYQFK